ncbi:FecR family protein [Acidisoma silvae]|uniref:FecR family protein n=1 Tax=Acidisoma silvae TaxID=2802396 RepID=A0A963YV57_9PROT|nr:FecR family protein [Acidisoma silvae]MCB8877671.1 FecR family protein [Acidisoma silvae]
MKVPDQQTDIASHAAAWVIRLGGAPLTAAEHQAFDLWLAQSPDHVAAFTQAEQLWGEARALKSAPGQPRHSLPQARLPRAGRLPLTSAGLALALFGLGAAWFWFGDPTTILAADDRTGPGEIRTVRLTDGSQVQLDTDSAIAVDFTTRQRSVRLLSGDAYFTAAPVAGSEHRPFVVAAGQGSAQALGTQFMVAHEPDGGQVTVIEHKVRVAAAGAEVTLSPGQAVRYDAAHGLEPVEKVNLEQVTSWRDGRLVFDNQPLSQVIAVLNRYRRGRILIANNRLAALRVSGVFTTSDLSGALSAISQETGARTAAMPPFITLLY